jgi:medium-chain acyl-[acyl-carrier-protein] hydrolase
MTLDKWTPFRNEGTGVRCRLFVFPHAGGNAAIYQPLRRLMPPEIDLCPVELPGRAARFDEGPLTSMSLLMEQLYHVLQPLMVVPFGFFGHSVGACMAYEATRRLRAADGRTAVHLFVSGRESPKRASACLHQAHPHSDDDLLSILRHSGGTPAAIMQRSELISALLPTLRADLALVEGYAVDPEHRIACPIGAFGGLDDASQSGFLQSWRDFTRGEFRTCVFPGGHFYFLPAPGPLAAEIVKDLRPSVNQRAVNTG